MTIKKTRSVFKIILLTLFPILIIGGVAGSFYYSEVNKGPDYLEAGQVYELWLSEVEVSPKNLKGNDWDKDSSAPDLQCVVEWEGQIILQTVVAKDSLIGRWETMAVGVSNMMQGEISTSSIKRVARVRIQPNESILLGIFDNDPLSRDFIGGYKIQLDRLTKGVNVIKDDDSVRRVHIAVTEVANDIITRQEGTIMLDGFEKLSAVPESMKQSISQLSNGAGNIMKEVDGVFQDAVEEVDNAMKGAAEELKKQIGSAAGVINGFLSK